MFIDTNILLLAAGGEHPLRSHCQRIIQGAHSGELELHASADVVQEYLFHRLRRFDRVRAVAETRTLATLLVLHYADLSSIQAALTVVEPSQVRGRDALIAAVALAAGFREIVSTDRDFDGVPGLSRRPPDLWAW